MRISIETESEKLLMIYNQKLKEYINDLNLPDSPGVYFFRDNDKSKDKLGNILYIGKATSLRSRVKSYMSHDIAEKRGFKIVNMILAATDVTFQKTETVLEALLLENKLIKEHKPTFNTRDKDDKTFTCIVITKEDYPRVLAMRIRDYEKNFSKKDVNIVYGPFTDAYQTRNILKIIRKVFPFRDKCELGQSKPCFNAQIGLCPGTCIGKITKNEYKKNIKNIKRIFAGKRNEIIKTLKIDMDRYAKEEKFELAAKARNSLWAFDHINDVALIQNEDVLEFKTGGYRIEAYDIAHISGTNRVGVMTVVIDGRKVPSEYKKFKLSENINDDYKGIEDILKRRMKHREWGMPDLIVFDGGEGQKNIGDKTLAELGIIVHTCSVVKDNRHKAKDILGDIRVVGNENIKKNILLANAEAHRFAINYHKNLREKIKKDN